MDSTSRSEQQATAGENQLAPAFTPGPWVCWSEENETATVVSVCHHVGPIESDDHLCVASAKGPDAATAGANAHLIAAAPDLYEACKELQDVTRFFAAASVHVDRDEWLAVMAKVSAALAKAEGR